MNINIAFSQKNILLYLRVIWQRSTANCWKWHGLQLVTLSLK